MYNSMRREGMPIDYFHSENKQCTVAVNKLEPESNRGTPRRLPVGICSPSGVGISTIVLFNSETMVRRDILIEI